MYPYKFCTSLLISRSSLSPPIMSLGLRSFAPFCANQAHSRLIVSLEFTSIVCMPSSICESTFSIGQNKVHSISSLAAILCGQVELLVIDTKITPSEVNMALKCQRVVWLHNGNYILAHTVPDTYLPSGHTYFPIPATSQ